MVSSNDPDAFPKLITDMLLKIGIFIVGMTIGLGIRLIMVIVFLAAKIPAFVVDSVLHTGRGIGAYQIWPFVIANIMLLGLASMLQSLTGDWIFLLWGVYVIKWIVEYAWAHTRRSSPGALEHSMHPGILLTVAVGLSNVYAAYLVTAGAGIGLLFVPTGWAVGVFLAWGAVSLLVLTAIADTQLDREERDAIDQQIVGATQSAARGQPARKVFHRVRIK